MIAWELISTSTFAARVDYPTVKKTFKSGSYVAATKIVSTVENVDGPCEDYGQMAELDCLRQSKANGFPNYQMTKGNKIFKMHNHNYFDNTTYSYSKCFACY